MRAGRLVLRCWAGVARATGRNHPQVSCEGAPVALIITEEEVWHAGDVTELMLVTYPVCEEHAPEEVHEMRSCADESEFVVVEIGGA